MSVTLLNHVLLPCVFPGNPVPSPLPFGFTSTAGTAIIAVVCFPTTVENQPWDNISRFKLDNGDALDGVMGNTPQLSSLSGNGTAPDTLDNAVAHGVNIYWIPSNSGGATAVASLITDSDFDCWIYEVDFGGATPTVLATNGYSNSGFVSISSLASGSVDGGTEAFYVAGCGVPDSTTTVNGPFTLDQTDVGGGYMCSGFEFDCAAAYYAGNGVRQATFNFADGPVSASFGKANVVIAAFGAVAGPSSNTLIIQKVTSPSGDPNSFTIRPSWKSAIALMDGQSDTTTGLADGTYSVTEDTVSGFSTVVTVSNSDPASAIALSSSATVTVTFTNTRPTISTAAKVYPWIS